MAESVNIMANVAIAVIRGADVCGGTRSGGTVAAGSAPVEVTATESGSIRSDVGVGSLGGSFGKGGSLALAIALATNN